MRAVVAAITLALAWTLSSATPVLADHWHLHCLTTPGGTHALAAGLTANASHTGFSRFHLKVHFGAFANKSASSPVTIAATSPTGSCTD